MREVFAAKAVVANAKREEERRSMTKREENETGEVDANPLALKGPGGGIIRIDHRAADQDVDSRLNFVP